MHGDGGRGVDGFSVHAMLVNVSGDRHQISEHGIAYCTGHGGISQGVQTDVDDPLASDDFHPFEDRTRIVLIQIIRRDQFGDIARGQLLHQRTDGADDLVEVGLVVLEGRHQPIEDWIVEVLGLQVPHQRNSFFTAPP